MGGAFFLSQPNCGTNNYGKKERPWMSKAYGWSGNYNKITWLEKKWQWWWKRFQLFIAWRIMVLLWCCWYIRKTDEGMMSFSMSIFFTFVYTTLQIVIITCVYIDISFVIFVHNHDLFFWINNSLHRTRW